MVAILENEKREVFRVFAESLEFFEKIFPSSNFSQKYFDKKGAIFGQIWQECGYFGQKPQVALNVVIFSNFLATFGQDLWQPLILK